MPISDCDPASFQILNAGDYFSRDENSLFYCQYKFEDIDFETYEILSRYYIKDKKTVFRVDEENRKIYPITGIDNRSFEVIEKYYAKDKRSVYFQGKKIKGCDIETFKVFNNTDVYSKDKYSVYYKGKKIPEADVHTFEIVDSSNAKDKNKLYEDGKVVGANQDIPSQ